MRILVVRNFFFWTPLKSNLIFYFYYLANLGMKIRKKEKSSLQKSEFCLPCLLNSGHIKCVLKKYFPCKWKSDKKGRPWDKFLRIEIKDLCWNKWNIFRKMKYMNTKEMNIFIACVCARSLKVTLLKFLSMWNWEFIVSEK